MNIEQMFGRLKIMSVLHLIQSVFELAVIVFIVWGFFNEDKFICFEKRLMSSIRRRKLKVVGVKCNAGATVGHPSIPRKTN